MPYEKESKKEKKKREEEEEEEKKRRGSITNKGWKVVGGKARGAGDVSKESENAIVTHTRCTQNFSFPSLFPL